MPDDAVVPVAVVVVMAPMFCGTNVRENVWCSLCASPVNLFFLEHGNEFAKCLDYT